MKNIIAVSMLALVVVSAAHAFEVPEALRDGVITVTLRDGKVYTFSENEYMVVKRSDKAPTVVLVPADSSNVEERLVEEKAPEQRKNRVRVMGGVGPSNELNKSVSSNSVTVETKSKGLGGIGYDRMLDNKWSVGGQYLSNGTATLGLGLDF